MQTNFVDMLFLFCRVVDDPVRLVRMSKNRWKNINPLFQSIKHLLNELTVALLRTLGRDQEITLFNEKIMNIYYAL